MNTRESVRITLAKQSAKNTETNKTDDHEAQLRNMLNKCVGDELMLTALLLTSNKPRIIPSNKKSLIELCIDELDEIHRYQRIKKLNSIKEAILDMSFKTDEFRWIDDKMSSRLEAFLRRSIRGKWIDIDGKVSEKTRFILTYKYFTINERTALRANINRSERQWGKIKMLNELEFLEEKNENFLAYFSEAHKKILQEADEVNRISLSEQSRSLNNSEDVLILLDTYYGDNSITRKSIVSKIRANWKQQQNRNKPEKQQINASVPVEVKNGLRQLAKKHNITETQAISILIAEELKNGFYINPL